MSKEKKEQENTVPSIQVPLNILAEMVNVIDLAAQRGAVWGDAMQRVGSLRNTLAAPIIEYNKAVEEASSNVTEEAEEEEKPKRAPRKRASKK